MQVIEPAILTGEKAKGLGQERRILKIRIEQLEREKGAGKMPVLI